MSPDERDELLSRLYISPADAARLMDVDARTVREAVASGQIPAKRVGAKILIPAAWVREEAGDQAKPDNGISGLLSSLEEALAAAEAASEKAEAAARKACTAAIHLRAVIKQAQLKESE